MRSDVLSADLAAERAEAVKRLLRTPLLAVESDPDGFRLVVRHHQWLAAWFETTCGWPFAVDVGAGFARLSKRPAGEVDVSRPLRRLRGSRQPFDRRRYQLLCVVAAELVQHPVTTIGLLAQSVAVQAALDCSRHGERVALVDALLVLTSWGAVSVTSGDVEDFVASEHGNAMLHAETTRLHRLLASARTPSSLPDGAGVADAVRGLSDEPRYGAGEDPAATGDSLTDPAQRLRWVRHTLGRRALDGPVAYTDELTPDESAYLANPAGRGWLRDRVDEAGLELEERADGFLVVDTSSVSTDIEFPGPHGNAHQLALLLVEELLGPSDGTGQRCPIVLTGSQVQRAVDAVFDRFPQWAKSHRDNDGRRVLASQAIDLLEAFALARRTSDGGLEGRPAIARYRVGEPIVTADPSLFDDPLFE